MNELRHAIKFIVFIPFTIIAIPFLFTIGFLGTDKPFLQWLAFLKELFEDR